jgi:competence protein ComEA
MNTNQGKWSIAVAVVVCLLFFSVAGAEQVSRLDLNHATLPQLDGSPGIGPVIAERIIQFREDNGPFKRIEDLMNVRGIGEKTFLKLRDQIMVEEQE